MVYYTGHAVSFVTYLTVYSGNKLPPFYIGYTSAHKIEAGYRGSVRSKKYQAVWDSELKENPNLFKTSIISTHDHRDDAVAKEIELQRRLDVLNNPLYVNRAIGRHIDNRGRKHSSDHVEKLRAKRIGRQAWNKGITNPALAERNRSRTGIKLPPYSNRGRKNPDQSERLKAMYANGWSPRVGKKHSEQARANIRAGRWPEKVAA